MQQKKQLQLDMINCSVLKSRKRAFHDFTNKRSPSCLLVICYLVSIVVCRYIFMITPKTSSEIEGRYRQSVDKSWITRIKKICPTNHIAISTLSWNMFANIINWLTARRSLPFFKWNRFLHSFKELNYKTPFLLSLYFFYYQTIQRSFLTKRIFAKKPSIANGYFILKFLGKKVP